MATTRVLFFDGVQVRLLRWHAGQVVAEDRYPATPVGHESLLARLGADESGPVYFLADIAEEGFLFDHIPYLQGQDRKALIERRLGQNYYGTPYVAAMSLGRETSGRRDERMLFAALTRRDMLAPWLDGLRDARLALRGLYSVPLVLAHARLPFAQGVARHLLVSVSSGGLRHTFFDNGQIRFSRLTQIATTRPDTLAETCHRETVKTVQYLLGQRQINRGTSLPVFVLAHAGEHGAFRERCTQFGDIDYQLIDLAGFAHTLGYKTPLADSLIDGLLAHLLVSTPPRVQFAPADDRHIYRLWQWRSGLRIAALICLGTGLAASAKLLLDTAAVRADTEQQRTVGSANQRRYQAILAELPPVPVTPTDLRALLARHDALLQRSPPLRPALMHLGATLGEFPGVELQRLRWSSVDKPEVLKVGAGGTAPAPSPPAQTPADGWTELDIEGTLPPALAGDQRRQIELLDRLSDALQRDGAIARVVSSPVEILPDKALRSDDRGGAGDAAAKPFVVRVYLPLRRESQ